MKNLPENISHRPEKQREEAEETEIDKFLKDITGKSIEEATPDYEAEFWQTLSKRYEEFPLADVSPELRQVVFYGLQNKIESVLESSKLCDEFKSSNRAATIAKLETFKLRRDAVINRINSISNILNTIVAANLKKEWEEEYGRRCEDFEKGLLEGENIDVENPEKRFYEIANWAKKAFEAKKLRYNVNPELIGESSNIIPKLFLDAIKYLSQIALEQLKNFEGKPKAIKEKDSWFDEKGRELFKGVAAFLAAESVLRSQKYHPAST